MRLTVTFAPILYVLSSVLFVFGVKALTKARSLGSALKLLVPAFALAAAGGVVEARLLDVLDRGSLVWAALGLAAGGALAILLVRPGAAAARVAWIAGLAAAGSGAIACVWLRQWSSTAGAPADSRFVATLLALGFALGALGAAALATFSRSASLAASARTALAVALAGIACALDGFVTENIILLVVGGMAGTAGLAVARIMAASASRSLTALLAGSRTVGAGGYGLVRSCGVEEAAMMLEGAAQVLVVPGFGMALAQAQHAVKELVEQLERRGAGVAWAIHPSAGRMPGHMNVVLDEANVPHDRVLTIEAANRTIADADAVLVVGANDVVNPAAAQDENPLAGLPILEVHRARSVFVIKRSLAHGAAGVPNPLFELPGTTMLFGDAKKIAQGLVAELKGGGH